MTGLRLLHDVLDAQLVDRAQEKAGRVDALLLELEPGKPPRVATICIGGPERARRIGRWMTWLSRLLRGIARVREPGVSRVPFGLVRRVGDCITIDVNARDLESGQLERWLNQNVVRRIPGARGKRKS